MSNLYARMSARIQSSSADRNGLDLVEKIAIAAIIIAVPLSYYFQF